MSDGGIKYDQDKAEIGLVPASAIEAEAMVWGFGAKKYGLWNWKKGLKTTRILSALLRHAFAISRGEDYDPETKLPHAAHIRCCAGMLVEFLGRGDLDDRFKPSPTPLLESDQKAAPEPLAQAPSV